MLPHPTRCCAPRALAALTAIAGLACSPERATLRPDDETSASLALLAEALQQSSRAPSTLESPGGASHALLTVAARLESDALFEPDSLARATARAEVGRLFREVYWDEGEHEYRDAALRHTRAALETRRRRLGDDHPDSVQSAYELTQLLGESSAERAEGTRVLEHIEARYRAERIEPCLGLARTLLELSRRATAERRRPLAEEATAMLQAVDAPPTDRLAASRRLAQVAHECGDLGLAARHEADFERLREQLGADDGLDLVRLTFGEGARLTVGGPQPGVLFDDDARAGQRRGARARAGSDTVVAGTTWRGEMNCGSDLYFVLDLTPRPEDPAPLVPGANLDVAAYVGTLSAPPIDEDPFVDHVHGGVRLWKVFDLRQERVDLRLVLRRATDGCAWPPTGHSLVFTEPLYVERTGDPDVCVVTTRHPSDPERNVDRVDLVRGGETLGTYLIPLSIQVERLR